MHEESPVGGPSAALAWGREATRRQTVPELAAARRPAPHGDGQGAASIPAARDHGTLLMLTGPTLGAVFAVGDGVVLGRGEDVDVSVADAGVSRRHARLWREGGRFFVQDLESANGTFVAGMSVSGSRELHAGDRIQVGTTVVLRFDLHDAAEQKVLLDLFQSAVRDPLTRAYNRRYLDERLAGELSYARRHDRDLAVLMVDIDHFKRVNDRHGHRAGDAVLRLVARLLHKNMRPEDILARYGGEEFCIVGRGLDGRNALILGERIRRSVQELHVPWEGEMLQVTVSVGVACRRRRGDGPSPSRLVADADLGLYEAKEGGRNRVCLHEPAHHPDHGADVKGDG